MGGANKQNKDNESESWVFAQSSEIVCVINSRTHEKMRIPQERGTNPSRICNATSIPYNILTIDNLDYCSVELVHVRYDLYPLQQSNSNYCMRNFCRRLNLEVECHVMRRSKAFHHIRRMAFSLINNWNCEHMSLVSSVVLSLLFLLVGKVYNFAEGYFLLI